MNNSDTSISNVIEFLEWIKGGKTANAEKNTAECVISFDIKRLYYRGQADISWGLTPSVLRENYDEYAILRKAERTFWRETSSFHSYLDKLTFFQHYGIYTRLLDVTFNPLVALYFACCDKDSEKGVVFRGHKDPGNSNIAELYAKYAFTIDTQNFVDDVINKVQIDTNNEIIDGQGLTSPLMIEQSINNPHIEAQNGAFIIAPLLKEESKNNYRKYRGDLKETDFFQHDRAVIEPHNKTLILKELSEYGINGGSIFRDITKKAETIMLEEEWALEDSKIDINST